MSQTHTVPLWEHENAAKGSDATVGQTSVEQSGAVKGPGTGTSLQTRIDRLLPPHKRYFGLRRKWFLAALLAAGVISLALIIGLSVGLTRGKKS